ncbi:MAG: aminotransferase class V-fold PLP-dependent enzyme [Firmicutes bacterium]|nr:aminotransferase class V-fold PLP-dependent enzyme [Bacillota bacterium]
MNKKARKTLCLLLALVMLCTFAAGCSKKSEEPEQDTEVAYTIDNIREYVIGVDEPVELNDGTMQPLINFDNAATTPALKPVMDAVDEEMRMYGSIGRGFSQKSNHSTDLYLETRETVLNFVGADPNDYTCFYVNNTTDGLNKLASALIESEDDLVLCTRIEHHANDLSWRERCQVIYAEVDEQGRIIYEDIERLLTEYEGRVKYVCVTAASNVTGYVTDVHRVAKMAHAHGARMVVDGAQIVAHRQFSMKGDTPEEDIDFFVFSAHKMYSPYGSGAVIGPWEVLVKHMPEFYGGGIVKLVTDYDVKYKSAPDVYEAGSPNYPGIVGMAKAMEVLQEVGFDAISEHEKILNRRLIDGLRQIDGIILYGDCDNIDDRVGVVTFNFEDINSYILAARLTDTGGVATRRGAFCAHPYVWRMMGISDEQAATYENCIDMNTPGMIRVSFGIYNTEEEVDRFLEILNNVVNAMRSTENFNLGAEPEF